LRFKVYERIYEILPSQYKNWLKRNLIYANLEIAPETYAGFSILYGISLVFVFLILYFLKIIPAYMFFLLACATFGGFEGFMHGILIVTIDNRSKFVEEILPDVLRLLSANIRSGLTIDKALLLTARPEFGFFEKDIKKAAKDVFSGETIENALKKIVEKFNSKILKRSIELLVEGISRGGNLPNLLDSLAEDIRQIKTLKKEVSSIVMMYVIFIFIAVGVGAPLLYAVSGFLAETMGRLGGKIGAERGVFMAIPSIGFRLTEMKISPEFMNLYSILAITVTSIFGGMLIGLVQEGSERAGLKFIPIILALSLTVFFITKIIITKTFGGMILL
jgi:flagellar protein FlaJ